MGVGKEPRIMLSQDASENGLRPSVSYLFRSVAAVFGRGAVGVLLTGMGRDGAEELKLMKDRGALTIAQDQESAVVHGMPGEAIKLDAAMYVLPPERIATVLVSLANKKGLRP
jgi:two-component system chemotaxis response regulator CheB